MEGKDVREWREARGLSQRRLARLLGVDQVTIYRWEAGNRKPPILLERALRDVDRELQEQEASKK
jgi:transcriptional regulator with XRE-family HTH domain